MLFVGTPSSVPYLKKNCQTCRNLRTALAFRVKVVWGLHFLEQNSRDYQQASTRGPPALVITRGSCDRTRSAAFRARLQRLERCNVRLAVSIKAIGCETTPWIFSDPLPKARAREWRSPAIHCGKKPMRRGENFRPSFLCFHFSPDSKPGRKRTVFDFARTSESR